MWRAGVPGSPGRTGPSQLMDLHFGPTGGDSRVTEGVSDTGTVTSLDKKLCDLPEP